MRTRSVLRPGLWAAALAWLPALAMAATFEVQIDTTPLAGQSGYMAFDLTQGDPGTTNQVDISSFLSTATLGVASISGDVTGVLPATVTLNSTQFFNEFLQPVVFAAGATTFSLTLSTNYVAGNNVDTFTVFLLDSSSAPYATTDPTGTDALLSVDLVAPATPQAYSSDFATISVVPEPHSAALALAGLLVVAGGLRLHVRARRRDA